MIESLKRTSTLFLGSNQAILNARRAVNFSNRPFLPPLWVELMFASYILFISISKMLTIII